jgi:60 kDa SS-A/Ro ribonucleoprotein
LATYTTDEKVKAEVKNSVFDVCRTSTMLFTYLNYVKELRGLGPSVRKAIARYYEQTPIEKLDLHLVKYRNREGFTHCDAMRLSHPKTKDETRNNLFAYAVGKAEAPKGSKVAMYEELKGLKPDSKSDVDRVVASILASGMPREGIPTEFLNDKKVWWALLQDMPMTAMIRNLGKMSSVGLFDSNMRQEVELVVKRLTDPEYVTKSRIHPLGVLSAIKVYTAGRGVKGSNTWSVNTKIADALDTCMYLSFKNVEATGKRFLLGMDVSGSMSSPVLGMDHMSAIEATAALAGIINATETNVDIVGFGYNGTLGRGSMSYGWTPKGANKQSLYGHSGLTRLDISKKDRMDTIVKKMQKLNMGGTDCSLPIIYALENKIPVDVFVITTDNETWAGNMHPMEALKKYRKEMGINAKLVVLATSVTDFSIADAEDGGALDIAGFDSSVMQAISEFIK